MKDRRSLGIAIVLHGLDSLGGMERQAALLAGRLARRGHRVVVVTTREPRHATLPWHELRAGVEVFRLPRLAWCSDASVLRAFEALLAHVLLRRRRRLDVVLAVQFTGGLHALRVAPALSLPVVLRFAGGGEDGDFAAIARRGDRAQVLEALGRASRYVCLTEEIRAEAAAAGLDPARSVTVHNGVDPERFSGALEPAELPELGPPGGRRVLLYVGRVSEKKGVAVLLRAVAALAERFPDLRLACAGAVSRNDGLPALARELGVTSRVAFLGTREDVPALHRAAVAFVLPSTSEGISNALLEALAAGTPVVATNVPGTNEVVRHEREALLVPRGDPVALAAALERLLTDPALARSLVSAGRRRLEEAFSIERTVESYAALFRAVSGEGRRRGTPHPHPLPRRGRGCRTSSSARVAVLHAELAWTFARSLGASLLRRLPGLRPRRP